jgi:diketogulonate reductase-like aldo/keto reductase
MNKKLINEPLWEELAKKYGKSKVQIILRWHIQKGNIVIPGSRNEAHIKSNIDIFDFALTEEEMGRIAKLDKHKKFLPIPRWLGSLFMPLIRMNFDKQK